MLQKKFLNFATFNLASNIILCGLMVYFLFLSIFHCDMFGNINNSMKDNKFYPKQMQKNSSYKKTPIKWQSGLFVKADGGVIFNLICRCRHLKVQETALVLISSLVSR